MRQFNAALELAWQRELESRRERVMDFRAAMAEGKDCTRYLDSLKPRKHGR